MAQYILFDLDGTLVESGMGIMNSAQYALRKHGIEIDDASTLSDFIGPPLRNSFMELYGFSKEQADQAITYYREYYSVTGIYENTLYPGVTQVIDKLRAAGKTVILATSKPTFYAEKILARYNLTESFVFIAGSEMDGQRSEKAEIIQYVLDEMHIADKREVVMIGDRRHDIIGAVAVGVDSIGVLYGYGNREEFEAAGATWIVESAEDLLKILL